jgi:methylthioxylose transferase
VSLPPSAPAVTAGGLAAPTGPSVGAVGADRTAAASWWLIGAAAVLLVLCAGVGYLLTVHGGHLHAGSTYPLDGRWLLHITPWMVPAIAVAIASVAFTPTVFTRLPWPAVAPIAMVGAALWATALALIGGPASVVQPITTVPEYLHDVPRVRDVGAGAFLRSFTDHVLATAPQPWTTHVAGHPPLATLVFVALATVGLGASGWAAAACILVGASAAASVLSTVRILAGESVARRAAPFVVMAPLVLWIATSADALFAGVAAAGLCAFAHAGAARGRRSTAFAVLAGLLLGACLFLSYGLVLLAPLVVAIVIVQRRPGPLIAAAVAVGVVVAAFAAAGFLWWHGYALTRVRVMQGSAYQQRPAAYFVFADPAVIAVMVGPAVIAAVAMLRRPGWPPGLRPLPLAVLVAIAAAIASNLAKGEVERIYLPFAVWFLPLAAALPPARSGGDGRGEPPARGWLAAQIGLALAIAVTTQLTW